MCGKGMLFVFLRNDLVGFVQVCKILHFDIILNILNLDENLKKI